jgi:hypothetical protein
MKSYLDNSSIQENKAALEFSRQSGRPGWCWTPSAKRPVNHGNVHLGSQCSKRWGKRIGSSRPAWTHSSGQQGLDSKKTLSQKEQNHRRSQEATGTHQATLDTTAHTENVLLFLLPANACMAFHVLPYPIL